MGIYDRDYFREEPRGLFLGGDRAMATNLVLINVAVYLADILLFNNELSDWMALSASLTREPWNCWQLLTYGFAHSSENIMHVAFNMLALWFFGREVETIYGKKAFLQLYLSLVIVTGLAWVASENLLFKDFQGRVVGASGAVFGVLLVYVLHYPMRMIYIWGLIPIPVWLLAGLYLTEDFVAYQRSLKDEVRYDNIAHAAHLAGALFGVVYYKTGWTLASLIPHRLLKKGLQNRPRLRLHNPEQDDQKLSERVDQILEKISREGESSLTREERRTLEDASRRYQQRRR